jgi:opacity protein-like surface antigen
MFSKFLKFATGTAVLALMCINANNAQSASIAPGMTFGVGAEWVLGIDKNNDFSFRPTSSVHGTLIDEHDEFTFHSHKDHGFGASVSIGYLMENGFEGGVEILYRHLKYNSHHGHHGNHGHDHDHDHGHEHNNINDNNHDEHHGHSHGYNNGHSYMETHNLIGLLKGTYYIDLGSMVYPYVTAGIGIAHIKAEGKIYNKNHSKHDSKQFIKFHDIRANKLAGDAGVGIAVAMQNTLLSLGVKVSGNQHISGGHHHNVKVTDGSGKHFSNNHDFNFGKLTQVNYEVEAKIKMIMG